MASKIKKRRTNHSSRCGSCLSNEESNSYFSFPDNSSERLKWMKCLHFLEDPQNQKICHNHFQRNDYNEYSKEGRVVKRVLKKGARPSIILTKKELTRKPGRKCYDCGTNDPKLGYFKFPFEDEIRFQAWVKFCETTPEEVLPSYVLCSKHFEFNCIEGSLGFGKRCKLVRDAIPTIKDCDTAENIDICTNVATSFLSDTDETVDNSSLVEEICVTPEYIDICSDVATSFLLDTEETVDNSSLIEEICVTPENIDICNNVATSFLSDTEETVDNSSLIKEIISDHDYFRITPSKETAHHSTPSNPNSPEFKVPKYIGSIKTSHLSTPQMAKSCFNLAKKIILKKNQKIKMQSQTIKRLKDQNATLRSLCDHLRKKFELSEAARNDLL